MFDFSEGKRYNSFVGYYRRKYGERLQKLVLDVQTVTEPWAEAGAPIVTMLHSIRVTARLANRYWSKLMKGLNFKRFDTLGQDTILPIFRHIQTPMLR